MAGPGVPVHRVLIAPRTVHSKPCPPLLLSSRRFVNLFFNTESYNNAVAKLVASLARHDQGASLAFVIDSFVVGTDAGGGGDHLTPTSLSTTTIRELIDLAPRVLYEPRDRRDRVVGRVVRCASAGSGVSPSVTRPAREAKELIKERQPWCDDELVMSRVA